MTTLWLLQATWKTDQQDCNISKSKSGPRKPSELHSSDKDSTSVESHEPQRQLYSMEFFRMTHF